MSAPRRSARIAALVAMGLSVSAGATPSGRKWFRADFDANPVAFVVYDHTTRPVNGVPDWAGRALPAIQAGFARWQDPVAVSCTGWRSAMGPTYTSPAGQAAVNGTDRVNRVVFLGGTLTGWTWAHDSGTLGLTTTSYFTGTGEIFDADMEINNDKPWKAGGQGDPNLGFDLQSVITHEAGHFLGLAHSAATYAVMYATFSPGEIKQNLTTADINDVCQVYPGTSQPPPTQGQIGTFCAADPNCQAPYPRCRGPAAGTGTLICTIECNSDTECTVPGYSCQPASPTGTTGKACLQRPGSPDLCRFCTSDQECSTGLCAFDQGRRWCTTTCQQASDCGPGYSCVTAAGNLRICQPTGGVCSTAIPGFPGQCSSSNGCAPGFLCVTGNYCQAPGTVGSRCELSEFCNACSICIGTLQEAYCRTCCGGNGAGGSCTTCGDPACNGVSLCASVQGSPDSVCVPASGQDTCAPCNAVDLPCRDGMTCAGGRCHPACNPDHPGRCPACYPLGTPGIGVCACDDQITSTGNMCGPQPTGDFIACQQGSYCVGSPLTCRAGCTLGDNTSCEAGKVCAFVDGKAVCTGGGASTGSRCGASVGACGGASPCASGLTCYAGRCYEACNPSAPLCNPSYGCVRVTPTQALCVCGDQRSIAGGPCGATDAGVYSCTSGLVCADARCRVPCDPSRGCAAGSTCQQIGTSSVCIPNPPAVDGGTDGGTTPPISTGCGCAAGGWAGAVPLLLGVLAFCLGRARRRRLA